MGLETRADQVHGSSGVGAASLEQAESARNRTSDQRHVNEEGDESPPDLLRASTATTCSVTNATTATTCTNGEELMQDHLVTGAVGQTAATNKVEAGQSQAVEKPQGGVNAPDGLNIAKPHGLKECEPRGDDGQEATPDNKTTGKDCDCDEATCPGSVPRQPGAYAVRHSRDRRTLPPAPGSVGSASPTSATSTEIQEELLQRAQAQRRQQQQQDQDTDGQPVQSAASGMDEAPHVEVVTERETTTTTNTTSADDNVPLLSALLVSDPPKGFDNCQICMTACDSGKGWEACKDQCVPDATFACHNDTLGCMKTVQEYADFIAFFGTACPNAKWTTHDVFWDGTTNTAFFHCTYHVTHTVSVPGLGPTVPTFKSSNANYCYIIKTDPARGGKITHIQKLWNDTWLLRDLGWIPGPEEDQQSSKKNSSPSTKDVATPPLQQETPDPSISAGTELTSLSPILVDSRSLQDDDSNNKHKKKKKKGPWGRVRKALGLSKRT